jgi:phage terminase small subunit
MADLTAQQRIFVAEYISEFPRNGKAAAIRAGYSPKTAENQASRLLTNVKVQEMIDKQLEEQEKRILVSADRVINEIADIAFDDISNYLEFYNDPDTGDVRTKIKDSKTINTKNIAEVSCGKDGSFKFKLYCKDNALSMLGKHLKLFTDKTEITGKDGADLTINVNLVEE